MCHISKYLIVPVITLMLLGCGGSVGGPDLSPEPTRKVMKNITDWYLKPPPKEGYRY